MKGIALLTLALIVAACAATSARAAGPVTIAWVSVKNRHVSVWWFGPDLYFGGAAIATRPDTDPNGNFLVENVVEGEIFDGLQDHLTFTDPIRPGTYWLRVDGFDAQCQSHDDPLDDDNGTDIWTGCDKYSNIVKFTVRSVCNEKLERNGYKPVCSYVAHGCDPGRCVRPDRPSS
jgi:hypothetical protein